MPRPHHVRARPPMPSLCGQTHQGPNSSLSPSGNLRVLASQEPWAETAHGAWWPLNEAGAICLLPTAAASLASLSESSGTPGSLPGDGVVPGLTCSLFFKPKKTPNKPVLWV